MTTEMILAKSVRYDQSGNPLEVVIPYSEFIDFVETYGLDLLDLKEEEIKACMEAERDRKEGNDDAFVPLSEVKARLGL